jgi:hypothetical protein
MLLFNEGRGAGEQLAAETARFRALLRDMERILEGVLPETLVSEEPPLLDRWLLGNMLTPALVGLSTGHPALPGINRPIATSPVLLMSADMSWARSLSRWYRLGRPAERSGLDA